MWHVLNKEGFFFQLSGVQEQHLSSGVSFGDSSKSNPYLLPAVCFTALRGVFYSQEQRRLPDACGGMGQTKVYLKFSWGSLR